ncbi:MAG: N-6 DNA methylase [Pyrinomonadaceae bacterium]|nr:N-6 DNA methylase [Pyrinomonadaceae bacterium]
MNEQTFSTAFSRVKELAEDFQAGEQTYLETKYSEAQARLDFIDKFWIALGWDVNHEREKNPYQQEVKVEKGVAVSNRLKKADYAFFAAPNFRDVKFYVEAKKPSRNLDNADDYFQTIRYGWSSNTPLAVLTDFEQFRVIDCRYKPNIATAQNFALEDIKFNYQDYADEAKFRRIYHLFSRDSVIGGSLDEYAKNLPKRGRGAKQGKLFATAIQKSVDESFLDDLDSYRAELARAFKNKNSELDGEALTEAVTRTIDRLVFMRFLEDKMIEPETMIDKFDSWADFARTSKHLEGRYNGVVFKTHFIDSKDFHADEKVFADVCGELSAKDSPYNFNYIPVHILGSIYERFLGKVIVATDKRAHVEEKPEVRKAGGVYYTPEYIVRYIVENTVGKLIENKTPAEIKTLRFADIACGSGSFLLGVYDYLLRYHTDFYNSYGRKETARKDGCLENADGSFTLTINQRREILRNNVYGVDIDAQATEVAQLSLALKLLEDATLGTIRVFQPKLGEKILPDMTRNIVCGNSLVDHDILDGQLFERNDERKLNPMSYEDKFPEIMRGGGFDAIVGNPPYSLVGSDRPYEQSYYRSNYSLTSYKTNTYVLFLEKGLKLLKSLNGIVSFIIPKSLVFNTYFSSVRNCLLKEYSIPQIIEIKEKVFASAEVGDSILFFAVNDNQASQNILNYYKVKNIFPTFDVLEQHHTLQKELSEKQDSLFYSSGLEMKANTKTLSDFASISNGLNPGNVRHILLSDSAETSEHKRMLLGRDINKYQLRWSGTWVNYNPKLKNQIKVSDIKSKSGMTPQTKVDFALRKPEIYVPNKIMVRKTADHLIATFDDFGYYFDSLSYSIQMKPHIKESSLYLLAILNSRYLNFIHNGISQNKEKVFAKVLAVNLGKLPIRTINFADQTEKAAHDKMVALVEQMLDAKKHLQTARTDKDKTFYQDKCGALDRQIDNLVYDLYDLTADEIDIVKGNEKQ